MSEVLNVLRLIMSRLGTHRCPNGHPVTPVDRHPGHGDRLPGLRRAVRPPERRVVRVQLDTAPARAATGPAQRFEVDPTTLVPDPDKTIDDGAVLPWNVGGRRLYLYAAGRARGAAGHARTAS